MAAPVMSIMELQILHVTVQTAILAGIVQVIIISSALTNKKPVLRNLIVQIDRYKCMLYASQAYFNSQYMPMDSHHKVCFYSAIIVN